MRNIAIHTVLPTETYFTYTAWIGVLLSGGHEGIEGVLGIVFDFEAIIAEKVFEMLEKVVIGGLECW